MGAAYAAPICFVRRQERARILSTDSKPRARGTLLLVILSIPVLILLLTLGTWQVHRLHWKEGLIQRIHERMAEKPVPLQTIAGMYADGQDIEYRPVTLSGSFIHEGERHYFATWEGRSGYFVHTPVDLGNGRYILVNRGFVPFDRKDPATRQEGQVQGIVTIGGIARLPETEKPSFLVPDNDVAQNIFYWRDIPTMARTAGLPADKVYPFFVDADNQPNPGGLPVGGVTRIDFPNRHLEYAVTWYGLAFALIAVLAAWLYRQWRTRP
jgi:Uncharacterized conserved protein